MRAERAIFAVTPVLALLLVLVLAAGPAAADPVSAFVASVTAGITAQAVVTFAVKTLVAVGLSRLLAPKPPQVGARHVDRLVNYAQPVTYLQHVLGRTRVGGVIGFTGFTDHADVVTGQTGAKRHYSVVLAAHPCAGVVTHYLGDREVEIDADGTVITPPLEGVYRIRPFLGGPGQAADAELVAAFSEVTTSFDFAGLSGAHLWARRVRQEEFSTAFPTGREAVYAPVIDGHNGIYDPRDDSTGHSRNAALIIAWWITQIMGQSVDWDEVAAEADVCDETVTNAEGGSQPRWRIDGVLSDDQDAEEQRQALQRACDAWMYERPDGAIGFRVGRYVAPQVTLTEADFLSCELVEGDAGRDWPTEIVAEYVEPANGWKDSPSGVIELDAGARQVRETVALPMVTSHNQAARVIARLGTAARARWRLSGTLTPAGLLLQGQRFVAVQIHGIDAVFEVVELTEAEDGAHFDLVARSVTAADFAFTAATDEPARPAYGTVSSDDAVPAVTGLTVVAQDGPILLAQWPAQDESLSQQIRISPAGAGAWQTSDVPAGDTLARLAAVVDGAAYDVQIRNRTAAARVSAWSATVTVTALANSTAPAAVSGLSAVATGSDVAVSFTAPSDANYHAARILRADYAAGYSGAYDIADAVVLRTEYGLPGNPDSWTDTGLAAGHYAWWVRPINASGVAGAAAGPVTLTIV